MFVFLRFITELCCGMQVSSLGMVWSCPILPLRLVGESEQGSFESSFLPLLRQDSSECSAQCPVNQEIAQSWLEGVLFLVWGVYLALSPLILWGRSSCSL